MYRDVMPQIKKLITDTFRSVIGKIDPARLQNTFEVSSLQLNVFLAIWVRFHDR